MFSLQTTFSKTAANSSTLPLFALGFSLRAKRNFLPMSIWIICLIESHSFFVSKLDRSNSACSLRYIQTGMLLFFQVKVLLSRSCSVFHSESCCLPLNAFLNTFCKIWFIIWITLNVGIMVLWHNGKQKEIYVGIDEPDNIPNIHIHKVPTNQM